MSSDTDPSPTARPGSTDHGTGESRGGSPQPGRPRESNSSSGDDLSLSLAAARPDPMLGEFIDEPPSSPADAPAPGISPGGSFDPLTGLLPPDSPAVRGVDSSDALASLGVDTGPNLLDSSTSSATRPLVDDEPVAATSSVMAYEHDAEVDEFPQGGPSWPMVLLASYASAVTIGLVWVLLSGRRLPESPVSEGPAFEATADVGRRAERARRLVGSHREPAQYRAELGQTVRLGVLEVSPLSVSRGSVRLERLVGPGMLKDGGENALILRIRFRNTSPDLVIAPLDEAYIRERDPGRPDSYIDPGPGRPTLGMYPLAVDSEWNIVGQDFRDLGPAESYETQIVSAPDVADGLAGSLTWRLRLRTGINQTDELDLHFDAGQNSASSSAGSNAAEGRAR